MAQRTCDRCGFPLPDEARFCPNCGAPVEEPAALERKLVTVLFADLADSTQLAAALDDERFREVMTEFYRMASKQLASMRGRAEKFVGDAVMAVFGIPHAHEDDALRAVRAGLLIRDHTGRLGERMGLPVPLHVRVGVASGPVATGPGPSGEQLVSGVTVNLAARLQQHAEPGEVLVSETARYLTREAVEFGAPHPVDAKGFDGDVTAFPVLELSSRSSRRMIPIVGRSRELTLMTDTFERVRDTSRPHLLTLLGEPGIGKSRLAEEFLASLPDDVRVLVVRAGEFEDDSAFAPLAEIVRREIGVERDAPSEVIEKRLDEVLVATCEPEEAEQVSAWLRILLGIAEEPGEGRPYRTAEIRSGFIALLQQMSRSTPVVLVFEDIHLVRPVMLELIQDIVRHARRMPFLCVVLAREELLEADPSWGGGLADAFTIRLEPLSDDEAVELALAAGESLDRETAERIAAHAGGNPFFIVEATGMVLHERLEDTVPVPHSHLLPPTVQAVVASRIDHLAPQPRELLRSASVFAGSTFDASELGLITSVDEAVLRDLEDAELLVRDRDRPGVWRFRHEMLREVAYETLAKRERLRLHLQIADGLEEQDGERYTQAIAYHLELAAIASLDLEPTDRSLADRAVEALARAGDKARRGMESRAAIHLYRRALALAGPEENWGRREAWIMSGTGEAENWLGEFREAERDLARALELGSEDPWTRAHASRFLADIMLSVHADPERAHELFDQALAAARQLGDDWVMARTLLTAGWEPYWRDDIEAARKMFEEALQVARSNPEGDPWSEARALTSLASIISAVAAERECLELAEEALELGRKMGDVFTTAVAEERIGSSFRRMWRLEEALVPLTEAARAFEDLGARWELASVLGERGHVYRQLGRFQEAEHDIREALDILRELRERSLISWTASEYVRLLLSRGQVEWAHRAFHDLSEELSAEEPGVTSYVQRLSALLALAEGDRETALKYTLEMLEIERSRPYRNSVAAAVWWVAVLFGPETVGGSQTAEDARQTLEKADWIEAIRDPELVAQGRY